MTPSAALRCFQILKKIYWIAVLLTLSNLAVQIKVWIFWMKRLGASIKDDRTISRKFDSSLVRKMPELAQPPLSVRYTINFEKPYVFCTKKCGRPHLRKPPPPLSEKCLPWTTPPECGVFYGQPLTLSNT